MEPTEFSVETTAFIEVPYHMIYPIHSSDILGH